MFPKCLEICAGLINIIKSYIICFFQLCRPPYNGTTNDKWKCDDDLFCLFNFWRNHHRQRQWSHHGLEGRQGLKSLERNAPGTNMIMIKPRYNNPNITIDAHGLKIQGEGQWDFCQILGGRVYRGCENFGGRVHLFGVLLHFY